LRGQRGEAIYDVTGNSHFCEAILEVLELASLRAHIALQGETMFKKFASSLVVVSALTFASLPLMASQPRAVGGSNPLPQARSRAVGGSNPLPQARAVGGSNPLPQAVGGSNPLPQADNGSDALTQADVDDSMDLSFDDDTWLWMVMSMLGIY
jgi:hypothetical protein